MRLRSFATGVVAFAFLLLAVLPSQASVLGTFTDRATWEGVTSGRTDITFESLGLSPGGFTSYSNSTGLTTGGVNFTGIDGTGGFFLYAVNPPSGADEDFGSLTILKGPFYRSGSYILASMPGGVTSFGLDLMSMLPAGATFRLVLDGVDIGFSISTAARPTRTFFGVQTDSPVSLIRIVIDSGTVFTTLPMIDNFSYGSVAAGGGETIEITTLLYVGTGIGLLGWGKRRRRLAAMQPA